MSEIPDDIYSAALTAYETLPLVYDGWDEEACIVRIAEALLAERLSATERAAKIAETTPDEPFAKHGQWHGTLRKSIVHAIRSQP